jgi:hypothetical protein
MPSFICPYKYGIDANIRPSNDENLLRAEKSKYRAYDSRQGQTFFSGPIVQTGSGVQQAT